MSDIGFYGLEAALVGVAMLALAGGGLLGEAILWRRRRGRSASLAAALVAPLAYGSLALALLFVSEYGSLGWKSAMDDAAWSVAGAGLVLWGTVRVGVARRVQRKA